MVKHDWNVAQIQVQIQEKQNVYILLKFILLRNGLNLLTSKHKLLEIWKEKKKKTWKNCQHIKSFLSISVLHSKSYAEEHLAHNCVDIFVLSVNTILTYIHGVTKKQHYITHNRPWASKPTILTSVCSSLWL